MLLLLSTAKAQYRVQIEWIENSPQAEKIISQVKQKRTYRSTSSANHYVQKIVYQLQKNQYLSANIDSTWQEDNNLHYIVFIGKSMQLADIHFSGIDSVDYQNLKIDKKLKKCQPATIIDINKINEDILTYYTNSGYPFANVQIVNMQPTDEGMHININVEKNNFVILDSIILEGNAKISKYFLYGYLGLKRKSPYNESVINKVNDRIQDLNFVQPLQPAGVAFTENSSALYIFPDKRKVNQFEGYLGVVPNDNISGKVLVTGNILLNLHNIFTIGESLHFAWKRIQVQSQTLDISMDFPYLFYTSLAIDGSFNLEKRDTSYTNLKAEIGLRYYIWQNGYIRAYYQYANSRLINNKSLSSLTSLPSAIDYNLNWYGLTFNMQHLDYLYNPRKGYKLNFDAAIGQKKSIKNQNINQELYKDLPSSSIQMKAALDFDFYIPIKKRWTWNISIMAATMYANKLYENELFKIGGLKTLRGFDQLSISASTYVIICNEIRFLFAKQSYLHAFFDAAGYEKRLDKYTSDFPFGFGLGISFETKAGIFSLSYALGKQLGNPIKFSTGKINFGYIAMF